MWTRDKNGAHRRLKTQTNELKLLAPRAGFEPATIRLTVECSTAELPRNAAMQSGADITKAAASAS
jgi:hypothetical protein